MKKLFLSLALIFLMQKSFAQSCNTSVFILPPVACRSACTDTVTFFSSGGTPPYTLAVTGGPNVQFTSSYTWLNVCPGSYFYTVTDASLSCQDTGTIIPVFSPLPLFQGPSAVAVCLGGSIMMCVSGASTYLWSPPTGLSSVTDSCPTANPTQTTAYTVIGTNMDGCTSSTVLTVDVFPPAIALHVTNETCAGCCDGIIAPGPCGQCSYWWSNSSVNVVNTNLCAGTYSVIVTEPMAVRAPRQQL